MNITYVVIIALITYICGAITKIFIDKILPLFDGMLLEDAKAYLNRIQNVLII